MRRWVVVGGGVAVVAVAVVVWLLVRSGGGGGSAADVGDRRAAALAFAPTSSEVVVEFDVGPGSSQGDRLKTLARTFAAARFAADGVRASVRSVGLDADADLHDLLGGPLIAFGPAAAITGLGATIQGLALDLPALARAGVTAATVGTNADDVAAVFRRATEDGRLERVAAPSAGVDGYATPDGRMTFGRRGVEVVLGANAAAVRGAFATRDARAGLTPATFDERLGPLARTAALVRAAGPARPLLAPRAGDVPWVQALREGSLAVSLEKPGVRLRVHLTTDPTKVTTDQLPIAPGAQAPQPASGDRQIHVALRDPAQALRFLDDNRNALDLPFLDGVKDALKTLDSVKGPLRTFGRIDVDRIINGLTGTATITPESPSTLAVRAEITTGDQLTTALDRLAAVPDAALKLAGVKLNVRHEGDAYIITNDGKPATKLAVIGDTLVVTNDERASLRAIAARQATAAQTTGALSLHLGAQAVQDELVRRFNLPDLARLVLDGFGDVDGGLRVERGGADLDATLALN